MLTVTAFATVLTASRTIQTAGSQQRIPGISSNRKKSPGYGDALGDIFNNRTTAGLSPKLAVILSVNNEGKRGPTTQRERRAASARFRVSQFYDLRDRSAAPMLPAHTIKIIMFPPCLFEPAPFHIALLQVFGVRARQ
jgi:hypothetical protein